MPTTTHGLHDSPEFRVWANIKQRCLNSNNPGYKDYGARGITICGRWKDSFENFYADMGPRPSDEHSLDRYPDNNGNYEPGNCRWATSSEQANNTRRNVHHTYQGERFTETQLARKTGTPLHNIRARMVAGMTVEEAVNNNDRCRLFFTLNGETKSLLEWANFLNIKYTTLYYRVVIAGKSFEEAIGQPVENN